MATPSGIALAMKYFGKKSGQTLAEFKDEWNELSDGSKSQLAIGLSDDSLSY
jgi:hypothetical protein